MWRTLPPFLASDSVLWTSFSSEDSLFVQLWRRLILLSLHNYLINNVNIWFFSKFEGEFSSLHPHCPSLNVQQTAQQHCTKDWNQKLKNWIYSFFSFPTWTKWEKNRAAEKFEGVTFLRSPQSVSPVSAQWNPLHPRHTHTHTHTHTPAPLNLPGSHTQD